MLASGCTRAPEGTKSTHHFATLMSNVTFFDVSFVLHFSLNLSLHLNLNFSLLSKFSALSHVYTLLIYSSVFSHTFASPSQRPWIHHLLALEIWASCFTFPNHKLPHIESEDNDNAHQIRLLCRLNEKQNKTKQNTRIPRKHKGRGSNLERAEG